MKAELFYMYCPQFWQPSQIALLLDLVMDSYSIIQYTILLISEKISSCLNEQNLLIMSRDIQIMMGNIFYYLLTLLNLTQFPANTQTTMRSPNMGLIFVVKEAKTKEPSVLCFLFFELELIIKSTHNLTVYYTNMNQESIALDPEIVQFGTQSKQLLKITNKTAQSITNCFFCLFNTSKYQFTPDSFHLDPYENKIVTVTLLNSKDDCKPKQFAYIKSKNFSKRITFLYSDANDDDKIMRSPSSGAEDLHTLSSRDYRQTQKAAYNRVLAEKEAYIKRLEHRLQENEHSNRKDRSFTSDGKAKNYYSKQIQQLQAKLEEQRKQKQSLLQQTDRYIKKIKELQSAVVRGQKNEQMDEIEKIIKRKDESIAKLKEDLQYLEIQCESLYVTISEKEQKIRKYQYKNSEVITQLIKQNESRLKQLESRIEEERKKSEKQNKIYKEKVKKLQDRLSESSIQRNKITQYEQQIARKQSELEKLENKLADERRRRKEYEQERKKAMRVQLQNQSIIEENSMLKSKIQNLQRSVEDLRQQTIIYKSKAYEQPDKASRYLEVALESCKNQNEILKKSRKQMQQSLIDETRSKKIYETKTKQLQFEIKNLHQEIAELKQDKEQIQANHRTRRDEDHQTIMKLRSQNIDLIEKMGLKKQDNSTEKELIQSQLKLQKSEEQMKRIRKQSEEEIKRVRAESQFTFHKLKQVEDEKTKMNRKIQKYKKQTAKQLQEISQSTLDQLKKVKEEKKKLIDKVTELEKSLDQQKQKNNKIDLTLQNEVRTRYPASQSDRRTGIKNQRREIEQTLLSLSRNQQIESMYSELGELREFKNYIGIQMRKMKELMGIRDQIYVSSENPGLIFNCVSMFDALRTKIQDQANDRLKKVEAQKQLSFLKGRVAEMEVIKATKVNDATQDKLSGIEASKSEDNRKLLELVREQMKNQYKKLHDTLSISQEKFEILKKKIYEEFRSRIIGILNAKEKDAVGKVAKVQAVLQRFVQGLANTSHKQALLSKQIKLKQEARKEVGSLKEKIGNLNQLLESKKGYCSRDPVKVFGCTNEPEWHDNIRLEAKMLTYEAENGRLLEQISLYQSQAKIFEDQIEDYKTELEIKQSEITKLKKQVIEIEAVNAKQLVKRQEDIDQLQKKFVKFQEQGFGNGNRSTFQKELSMMRQEIQRKKDIIKNLKEKQKLLEQLVQSNRSSENSNRNKNKRETVEEARIQQSLRQFKQNNRQLRSENSELKRQIEGLRQQISRKNQLIKKTRGEEQETRIRAARHDYQEVDKLKGEIRILKDEVKSANSEVEKLRKKKEKEALELESERKRIKNEYLIEKRSLESIVRALCDSIKRVYADLDIMARRKGVVIRKEADFQELLEKPGEIDSIKVYEAFEELFKALKS